MSQKGARAAKRAAQEAAAALRPGPPPTKRAAEPGPRPPVGSDAWIAAEIDRLGKVAERWKDPSYSPLRLMSPKEWAPFSGFARTLERDHGKPVLYASRSKNSLLAVYPTGALEYEWARFSPRTAEHARLIDGLYATDRRAYASGGSSGLFVADLSGVPFEPVLVLTRDYNRGGSIHIPAPGDHAGAKDAIWALHLGVAGRPAGPDFMCGTFIRPANGHPAHPAGPVWQLPPPPPKPKPLRTPPKTPQPEPRLVRDAREAELLVADWIRWMGWHDAQATPVGTDAGVDVLGADVVAQVKFEAVKTGRPVLQALFGAGHGLGVSNWIFVSSAGYTAQALEWAESVEMALFRFSLDGQIEPVSHEAERFWHRTQKYGTAIWPLPEAVARLHGIDQA